MTTTYYSTPSSIEAYNAILAYSERLASGDARAASAPQNLAAVSSTGTATSVTLLSALELSPFPTRLITGLLLLFLGLAVAFAGRFFTLDRTRWLVAPDEKNPPRFPLTGGLGGAAGGFLAGSYLAILIALIVPNLSPAKSLSSIPLFAVWLGSGILIAVLGARYRWIALMCHGFTGGLALTILLLGIFRPSALLARHILLAISLPLLSLLPLLPFSRIRHILTNTSSSLGGAFAFAHACAILAGQEAWIDYFVRLVVQDWAGADGWGGSGAKGLTAGLALIAAVGGVADEWMHRTYGENPDEEWNSFLGEYTSRLAYPGGERAGVFQPAPSGWDKFTSILPTHAKHAGPGSGHAPLPSHPTRGLRSPHAPSTFSPLPKYDPDDEEAAIGLGLRGADEKEDSFDLGKPFDLPGSFAARPLLSRGLSRGSGLTGTTIVGSGYESDEDEKDLLKNLPAPTPTKPKKPYYARSSTSSSSASYRTLANPTSPFSPHYHHKKSSGGSGGGLPGTPGQEDSTSMLVHGSTPPGQPAPPPGGVVATRSLILAFERIAAAQREARELAAMSPAQRRTSLRSSSSSSHSGSPAASPKSPPPPPPVEKEAPPREKEKERWEEFWKDVEDKAGSSSSGESTDGREARDSLQRSSSPEHMGTPERDEVRRYR